MTAKGQFTDLEEEPPAWVKAQYEDWMKLHGTLDEKERVKIMRGLFDRFYENLPCFGTVGVPQAVIMKPEITNVPEKGVWGLRHHPRRPGEPGAVLLQEGIDDTS